MKVETDLIKRTLKYYRTCVFNLCGLFNKHLILRIWLFRDNEHALNQFKTKNCDDSNKYKKNKKLKTIFLFPSHCSCSAAAMCTSLPLFGVTAYHTLMG